MCLLPVELSSKHAHHRWNPVDVNDVSERLQNVEVEEGFSRDRAVQPCLHKRCPVFFQNTLRPAHITLTHPGHTGVHCLHAHTHWISTDVIYSVCVCASVCASVCACVCACLLSLCVSVCMCVECVCVCITAACINVVYNTVTVWCFSIIPSPDCCVLLQSLWRRSTRSSHNPLHAGSEALQERERWTGKSGEKETGERKTRK